MEKQAEIIRSETEEFLSKLGIAASVSVSMDEEVVLVSLDTEETGMIIGFHGETLEALQLVLSLMVAKKIGNFVRISIEVGDYKKNRTAFLERMVADAKQQVLLQKEPVSMPNLRSWERRVVHMMLQDDKEVVSESIGEGRDRTLTIRQRE